MARKGGGDGSKPKDAQPLAKRHGRPTDYSQTLATTILTRLMAGESLRSICRDERLPARSTVHLWLAKNKDFSDQYVRACDVRADDMFDEMFEIADDARNDWMERHGEDDAGWQVNGEHIQRARVRIDTRKWALSRMNPKKYGEKVTSELTGPNGGPILSTSIDPKALTQAQLEALATIPIPADRSGRSGGKD